MKDYKQEFLDQNNNGSLVYVNGEILYTDEYVNWLEDRLEKAESELKNFPYSDYTQGLKR